MVPLFLVVYKMGMYDTYWGLIIPRVAVAGSIFMMRAAFTGIPKEMAEAARIDGLSEFGIFWENYASAGKTSGNNIGYFKC